jgi:hypothetical protein
MAWCAGSGGKPASQRNIDAVANHTLLPPRSRPRSATAVIGLRAQGADVVVARRAQVALIPVYE